jgi:SRSO17 transposase
MDRSRPLLIEWPNSEAEPTKYWFSTIPEKIAFHRLVDLAKLRWRIGRDYQELKQEVGLGHFEGRGWRGFHHRAALCIAAYGFLIFERETIHRAVQSACPSQRLPYFLFWDCDSVLLWKNVGIFRLPAALYDLSRT